MRGGSTHRMTQLITIKTPSASPDGRGGQVVTWSTLYANVWAEFSEPTGGEWLQAQALQSAPRRTMRIRYRTGVTTRERAVLESGVACEILSVTDEGMRQEYLLLETIEVGST